MDESGARMVAAARSLAESAHAGQLDKAGVPYIHHPSRVAARVHGDAAAEAVAWLHDVVEDTGISEDDLRQQGFPEDVVQAVGALTRRSGQDSDDYYDLVAGNPLALRVKFADIADNTDPARVAALDPDLRRRLAAKYEHALARLQRPAASPSTSSSSV